LYSLAQRFKEAMLTFVEASAIYYKLADANPDVYMPSGAMTLNGIANVYLAVGYMQEAEGAFGEALAIYRKLAESNPVVHLPGVAMTLQNLGIVHRRAQRAKEAADAYDEALSIYRKLAAISPDAYMPYVAGTLANVDLLHLSANQLEKASVCASEAERVILPFWKRDPDVHGDTLARILLARTGVCEARGGSLSEQCSLARQMLAAAITDSLKKSAEKLIDRCSAVKSDEWEQIELEADSLPEGFA
jgi:tetratricopeptide (TPR) repeat protein